MNICLSKTNAVLTITTMLSVLGVTVNSAHSAIIFTYGDPGVQTSSATSIFTEDFNVTPSVISPYVSTAISGKYSIADIRAADQYGGAGGTTPYLVNFAPNITTLTLDEAQAYFGMWWSAGDDANLLEFYSGSTLLASYTTATILSILPPPYFGNPNPAFLGQNGTQAYAYINFFGTDGTTFDKVVIGGSNFESDNHSVSVVEQDPTGTPVDPPVPAPPLSVPEPTSVLGLLAISALGAGSALKRKI